MPIIYSPAPVPAPAPPAPPLPVSGPIPLPAPPASAPESPVDGPIPLPAPPAPEPINVTLGAAPVTVTETPNVVVVTTGGIGFGKIAVNGSETVNSTIINDLVTFVGSTGISITSNDTAKTITWASTGVTSLAAGSGITVSGASGAVTVTNSGILNVLAGNSISVSTSNGNATITNTFTETVYNGGNATGNLTPNRNNGSIQNFTLTGNITLLPVANINPGQWITLILTQDSTGNRLLDANTAYLFASGFQTLTTDSGAIDMINIFYDGSSYYATLTVDYS